MVGFHIKSQEYARVKITACKPFRFLIYPVHLNSNNYLIH